MRIASSTMSEASMKTWLAASAAPKPTTAMPPQAMPLASSSQMNMSPPLVRRCTSPRGSGQEVAAGRDHEELDGDDRRQPRRGLHHRRPEHRGQREDDGEQREGDARGQLVAHEHRQQLVLEFGLDARCPATGARASRATAPAATARGILGARAVARAGRRCLGRRCIVSCRRLGHRMPSCDTGIAGRSGPMQLMSRQIPKFWFNANKL